MSGGPSSGSSPQPGRRSAASLSPADLARLLSASGAQHVSVESIERDVAAGAPASADGTLNLVHYGAWLARQAAVQEARQSAAEPGVPHGH